jgi:hypothetical protein
VGALVGVVGEEVAAVGAEVVTAGRALCSTPNMIPKTTARTAEVKKNHIPNLPPQYEGKLSWAHFTAALRGLI